MDKKQIIEAIKALARNGLESPGQRQADLADIEFAAQAKSELELTQ